MLSFRPVAALLALAMLPAFAPAADDVGALRAELQALKNEYGARVDALEARIQQLEAAPVAAAAAEPPPPAPRARGRASGGGASAFNPAISLILGGSYANTSRDPDDWNIAGFPAERRRGRPRRAQLQSRRIRAHVQRQRRSVLLRPADRGDHRRRRDRSRRGLRAHDGAAGRFHREGRPLLLRLRLSQRGACARLGFRRPAARLPGVLRRPARAGRRAGEMARADRPVHRVRRRERATATASRRTRRIATA